MAKKWNPKSRIIAACRQIWSWSPIRKEALKLANNTCANCGKKATETNKLQVDHVDPVIDIKAGWKGFDSFIKRLLDIDPITGERLNQIKVQAICRVCHETKTTLEKELRKKYKPKKEKKKK